MIGTAAPQAKHHRLPLLGFGQVRHTRLRPVRNAFAYGTYFLMLPMRSLQAHGPGALGAQPVGAFELSSTATTVMAAARNRGELWLGWTRF